MTRASSLSSTARRVPFSVLLAMAVIELRARPAHAQAARVHAVRSSADGVYGRFDGDLDLGFALCAQFGSAGHAAAALRGSSHYFSIAGVYASGRIKVGDQSAPSLFGL